MNTRETIYVEKYMITKEQLAFEATRTGLSKVGASYFQIKKILNDLNHKAVIFVTRQTKLCPRFAGRRASSSFALREGLIEELAEKL